MKQITVYTYNELTADAKKTALEHFKKRYMQDYSSEVMHIKDDIFNCLEIGIGFENIYWDDYGRVTEFKELEIYKDFYEKHGFAELLKDLDRWFGLIVYEVHDADFTSPKNVSFNFDETRGQRLYTYENLYKFVEKYDSENLAKVRLLAVTCPHESFEDDEDFEGLFNAYLSQYVEQMEDAWAEDMDELNKFISSEMDYYTSDKWAEEQAENWYENLYYTEDGRLIGEM
jgi:hypothetical protein